MQRLIWRDNFPGYFDESATFIASRHAGYHKEVIRIKHLALQAQEQDIRDLACYLRPWNLETEGNWMGREWLRLKAMQALCYLGAQSRAIEDYLKCIALSPDPQWHHYDTALRDTWQRYTDSSCLVDPYADFLRCLNEVLECITATKE